MRNSPKTVIQIKERSFAYINVNMPLTSYTSLINYKS